MLAPYFLMILGLAVSAMGLVIWRKQMLKLIHSYHYSNVKQEDRQAYTKAMGQATIVVGVSIFAMGLFFALKLILIGIIAFFAIFMVSIVLFCVAQKKYNGGLF